MNKTTVSLGIVALLAISGAFYFGIGKRRAEISAAEATLERASLQASLASAEQRTVQAEQEAAAKRNGAEVNEKPSSGGVAKAAGKSNAAVTPTTGFRATPPPTDSEGVQRMREDALDATYAALFRQLEFAPAQIERFKTIKLQMLEKRNQLFGERITAVAPENGRLAEAEVKKIGEQIFREMNAENEASLRGEFGEKLHGQIQHFESTLPVRFLSEQLAAALFHGTAPLEPRQADQLVEVIAKSARNAGGKVDANALNGVAVLEEAGSILKPVQMAAFSRIVSQQVKTQLDRERLLDSSKTTVP